MNVEYQLNYFGNSCGNGRDREIEQIVLYHNILHDR